jgi:outer membrane protein assembly factor BamA
MSDEIIIGNIIFEGNQLVTDDELSNTIYSRTGDILDHKKLNEDTSKIAKLYKKKEFLNVKAFLPEIQTNNTLKFDVIFVIEEKQNPQISKLEISGNRYISSQKLLSNIASKFTLEQLNANIQKILEFYNESGFLFASVNLDSLSYNGDELTAFCKIEEGSYCEFREFRFKGNKVTKNNTLIKLSGLQSTDHITPDILEKAADNLLRKQYIKECDIIPIDHKQLLISIEEDKMSLFSGIVGYDNSQKKDKKLTGFVNVEFLNLYGTDRNLIFLWQRLNADRTSIEMSYHESGPRQIPLSADVSVSRLEADSTYIQTTLETDVYYYDLKNKYGAYFAFDEIFPGSGRPKLIEQTSYQKIGAFWQFSSLDYYQNPTKGIEFNLRYYYIFNKFENSNISKQAVKISWIYNKKIFNRIVFNTGFNANLIENKELNELEYFHLGGSKNLRGFTEDQFSGYRTGWINTELRYLLSRTSRFFVFTDYGYVESQISKQNKLFGFGFGFRLQTKLGLLGLDYGFSYNGTELRNPLDGIIHFGLESKL